MNNEHKPLLSDSRMEACTGWGDDDGLKYNLDRYEIRDIYEKERAKDRELIQKLVDALENTMDPTSFAMTQARLPITKHHYQRAVQQGSQALRLAAERGITPTDR